MNLSAWIEPVVALARDAGDAILEVYATDFEGSSQGPTIRPSHKPIWRRTGESWLD